jgi:hypothetical protein
MYVTYRLGLYIILHYKSLPFFDKKYILIREDTNYTQPLQQRNALISLWMHTAKKHKKNHKKEKVPLE